MGRRKLSVPTLRYHRASGQYYVSYPSDSGISDCYLGKKSKVPYTAIEAAYRKKVEEFLSGSGYSHGTKGATCGELANRFLNRAKKIYVKRDVDGSQRSTGSYERYRLVLSPLVDLFEDHPIRDFRAPELIAVRDQMIRTGGHHKIDKKTGEKIFVPIARSTVNHFVRLLRNVFSQAESLGLEYPDLNLLSLNKIKDLLPLESDARETAPVESVPDADFAKVLAELRRTNPVVADMAEVQWGTGLRSSELCNVRPCDLDQSIEADTGCWEYRLADHKTISHRKVKRVAIGPKAIKILRPYIAEAESETSFLFSPAVAAILSRRQRFETRSRKPTYTRKENPQRVPGERYNRDSYRKAIQKAAERVGVKIHPHQIRHRMGKVINEKFGIEAVRNRLGHTDTKTSETYIEYDRALDQRAAREFG